MRSVGLVADRCFAEHETGAGHPERPERTHAVLKALDRAGLAQRCRTVLPEAADDALLTRVHDRAHLDRVRRACSDNAGQIDSMDTAICPASDRVARLAAGAVVALCRRVARREIECGFAAVRPPGHHAERDMAMGFCLFNNVAVAARDLQEREGQRRVLILDWDVHHGNGTQHIFEEDPSVFYASVHQWPLYPGTGSREERGRGPGAGTTLNCPLPPGSGDEPFLKALRDEIVPAAERFDPHFILLSAGFDAHEADPLGGLEVTTEAYAEATRIVLELAERCSNGKLVSVLEGGYRLDALADSVTRHLEELLKAERFTDSAPRRRLHG